MNLLFSIFYFFKGYLRIAITGKGKERFLNLCSNKKILIWKLRRKQDTYEFCVSKKAFVLLTQIKEKTNITWQIKGEYGLPFFLYRHRRRKGFFLGIIFCILSIYLLSLFIWDIQIIGTKQYTKEEIKAYLKEKQITTGKWKKGISCSNLEEEIREDFPDTAWVSCDIEGTCLSVHIKESIDLSDLEIAEAKEPRDIVASKSGTIVSIVTRNGTPLVKKGDDVKKGDTLISGILSIYNEYDELLETSETCADGDILAKTTCSYHEEFPLSGYDKDYQEEQKQRYTVFLGEYAISLPASKVSFSQCDVVKEKKTLKIGNSFYLPLSLEVTNYLPYEPKPYTLTKEQAKEKAEKKIAYDLEQLAREGKEVTGKELNIQVTEDTCVIDGTITMMESIGKIAILPKYTKS